MVFDFDKFHIGTYIMGPHTKENVEWLHEAGIDFVIDGGFTEELLDEFAKRGMGVFLNGVVPGWWGGDGERAGQLKDINKLESYESGVRSVKDHPAIWAIDVGDEPSALDFEYYGKITDTVHKADPKRFAYLNLYPGYASVIEKTQRSCFQLGTATFKEYLEQYVKYVDLPYVCFDHYPYHSNRELDPHCISQFFADLDNISEICRESGRHFWIVIQVNNNDEAPQTAPTESQLYAQAYTALAYGADLISWACWYPGWWSHNVLDRDGKKTEQYDKLCRVNPVLHALGNEIVKYKNVRTDLVGFKKGSDAYAQISDTGIKGRPTAAGKVVSSAETKLFKGIVCPEGFSMTVGQMVSKSGDGAEALMIADSTDYGGRGSSYEVSFSIPADKTATLFKGTSKTVLKAGPDGLCKIPMEPCGGFLVTLS